jgi:hypothetical protein
MFHSLFLHLSKTKKAATEASAKKQSIEEYKASPVNSNVEDKLLREAVSSR